MIDICFNSVLKCWIKSVIVFMLYKLVLNFVIFLMVLFWFISIIVRFSCVVISLMDIGVIFSLFIIVFLVVLFLLVSDNVIWYIGEKFRFCGILRLFIIVLNGRFWCVCVERICFFIYVIKFLSWVEGCNWVWIISVFMKKLIKFFIFEWFCFVIGMLM